MASPKLSHVILNTSNYEATKRWYLEVLEATIGLETSDQTACFLRIDESHHRIGLFKVAETDDSPTMTMPGATDGKKARINHLAFEYPTLEEVLDTHERIAHSAIVPKDHTTYYRFRGPCGRVEGVGARPVVFAGGC